MTDRDTICALATGPLPSALAVIRVSGPDLGALCDTLLRAGRPEPRRAQLTHVLDDAGRPLDEAVCLYFPRPASYTGEDVLELTVHGGRAVVNSILDTLIDHHGLRLAEPGEFTRRALEAGKVDLTEAEAVADLVNAETAAQRDQALRQLGGEMSTVYESWRSLLVEALALIEVVVDFPDEEDAPDFTHTPVLERLRPLAAEIDAQLADGERGEIVRDGYRIALIGPPNAGKSSLLNALAGREAAIVTDIPGTTRDIIEIRIDIAGQLVWLTDTAGLRESADRVELEGIRRARAAADAAELRLLVIDGSADPGAALAEHEALLGPDDLIVLNKTDLGVVQLNVSRETFGVSARTGDGLGALLTDIGARLERRIGGAPPLITRRRHRERLAQASRALGTAISLLEADAGAELAAEEVRRVVRALDQIIGRVDVEDVLGAIFSRFCIGK